MNEGLITRAFGYAAALDRGQFSAINKEVRS